MNLIDTMTEREAKELLNDICGSILSMGGAARTHGIIMTNLRNCGRFADQLHAIEREFFMVPGETDEYNPDPDGDVADVCLVNCWGSTTEQYVAQFRNALNVINKKG